VNRCAVPIAVQLQREAGRERWRVSDVVEVWLKHLGESIVSESITSETRWPTGLAKGATRVGYKRAPRERGRRASRRILDLLDDGVFLLLAVLLIPVGILVLGTPLVLVVRLLLEIVKRM
jgi:hypothetical protein